MNAKALFARGESQLSADDDVHRSNSPTLSEKSRVRKAVIPGKKAGFAITTLGEPRMGFTYATRAAKVGETTRRTIEHLLMNVTRSRHPDDVSFNHEHSIFMDRGYMTESVIGYLESSGILFGGASKRGFSAPFSWGEAASRRFKGVVVPQKGIRCDLWAKAPRGRFSQTHLAHRESSGC